MWACRSGVLDAARKLIDTSPALIEMLNQQGFTALHCACGGGHPDLVRLATALALHQLPPCCASFDTPQAMLSSHALKPCSQAMLLSHALKLCSQAMLLSHALKPCSQAVLSSHALKPCSQAVLLSHALKLCSQAMLSSHALKPCSQAMLLSHALKLCSQAMLSSCALKPCSGTDLLSSTSLRAYGAIHHCLCNRFLYTRLLLYHSVYY
jgi:hypothetical protein